MSQKNSAEKAIERLSCAGVASRDARKRLTCCTVPADTQFENGLRGSSTIAYVNIAYGNQIIQLTCNHYQLGSNDGKPCPAPENGWFCFHSRATLLAIAEDMKATMSRVHQERSYAEKDLQDKQGLFFEVRIGKATGFVAFVFKQQTTVQPINPIQPQPQQAIETEIVEEYEKLKKAFIAQRAELLDRPRVCGQCRAKVLLTDTEKDSGHCSTCDRSTPAVTPTVEVSKPKRRGKKAP